ncbi:MAG: hypothetical protein BalsKO_10120 [Balneolaceae bacterium]
MVKPDNSVTKLVPYIRLTKDQEGNYTLWAAIFIPKNYSITQEPSITIVEKNLVQVDINVEGPKDNPAKKWEVVPLKISLPTPEDAPTSNAKINVTVYLDDPEEEGSAKTTYEEAEEG